MRFSAKKILIVTLLVVSAAASAVGLWSYWHDAYIVSCLTNYDVSASEREPYENVSLTLAENMVRGKLNEVYSQTTVDAKSTTMLTQLATLHQSYKQPMTTLARLRVTHTYLLQSLSRTEANVMILCPAVKSGTLSRPEDKVFLTTKSGATEAHVVVEGDSNSSTWNFVFWLRLEEDVWRMQSLYFGPAVMFGKSADSYWAHARGQRDAGHMFNAAMLYYAARALAFRGPNFQLGIWREIDGEARSLRLPAELEGTAPYFWQFGTDSFRVLAVIPFFAGGETNLTIRIDVPRASERQTDELNHTLIRHLTTSYPEIFESFDAVVVEAVEPGGPRSYRTVQYGRKTPKSPGR
jgi:hypothetical protein